jgi:hypothetical protein
MKRITIVGMISISFCLGYILAMKDQRKIIQAINATQTVVEPELGLCMRQGAL